MPTVIDASARYDSASSHWCAGSTRVFGWLSDRAEMVSSTTIVPCGVEGVARVRSPAGIEGVDQTGIRRVQLPRVGVASSLLFRRDRDGRDDLLTDIRNGTIMVP
jgi:hypothetical protein